MSVALTPHPPKRVLAKHHLADLKRSALTDATIKLARVYTETDPDCIKRLLNWEHPATALGPCLVFPFFGPDGATPTYHRVKPDRPRTVSGKTAKYESPRERPNSVYLPPAARKAVGDVRVPLVITEGEKKSLAADQYGHACVGLVGAWGWVKKRDDETTARELNPDLADFVFTGRTVYIVLDSDAAYKDDVRFAEWELAKALSELKANVLVVRLPAKLGGPKVGIDDYLLAHGVTGFAKLLDTAGPPVRHVQGFSNMVKMPKPDGKAGEMIDVPRSAAQMAAELVGKSGGWPRVVGDVLVVPDSSGELRSLTSHHDLSAFIGGVFDGGELSRVKWSKAEGAVGPQVLLAHLAAECQRFRRADPLPHVPPLDGVLYTRPTSVPDGKGEILKKFLSFFSPASVDDESLLLACLLTPLWGGPPGKRPAFLFEAAEGDTEGGRGVGKSTIAQKIAAVYGGAFSIDAADPFAKTVTRLLTPSARGYRILLMDNVKTFRLSSGELEGLITSPEIDGHRMWKGQGVIPNYYTLLITMNGASLARDVAQRVIPVHFKRAKYRADWEAEVDAFLVKNRTFLIGDLTTVLQSPALKLSRVTRWSRWETEVLTRVPNPDRCTVLVDERTKNMDADREDGDRIREMFCKIFANATEFDPTTNRVLLTSAAITRLVELALNERLSAARASSLMASFGVPGFRRSPRNGRRLWLWTGDRAPSGGKATRIFDYDSEAYDAERKTRGMWKFEAGPPPEDEDSTDSVKHKG